VRFTQEPEALRRHTVAAGSQADGTTLAELPSDDVWISLIIRDGQLVAGAADTALRAGDEVLVVRSDTADTATITAMFTHPETAPPPEA
jgi:potassium/hydrogen antiporter